MVGRSADAVDLSGRTIGAPLLRVRGLARGKVVNPTSFDLRAGEILGIAGLIGSGRTELLRLIFGADRADAGAVFLGDSEVPAALHSPQAAVQAGIAMITEDRKGQGLLLRQSIAVNTTLASLDTVSHAGGLAQRRGRSDGGRRLHPAPAHPLAQQRANGGRAVWRQPAKGGDRPLAVPRLPRDAVRRAHARHRYRRQVRYLSVLAELARQGKGLVVVSSDLRELMLICDRIAVMSAGSIVETFERAPGARTRCCRPPSPAI
jgi:ribose transport system ATP-binding protein